MLILDIVTPDRQVVKSLKVKSVTLPGSVGEMTILEGHAVLLSTLSPGVVQYEDEAGKLGRASVSTGFVEVQGDRVAVLAETLEMAHEIDVERAKRAQSKAEDRLAEKDLSPEAFNKYQLKLQRSLIRQQVHTEHAS